MEIFHLNFLSFEHIDEVLKLMHVLTGDDRYEMKFSDEEKERGVRMCDVLDKAEEKGKIEGRAEGRAEKLLQVIEEMVKDNMSVNLIAKYCGETVEHIEELVKELSLSAAKK